MKSCRHFGPTGDYGQRYEIAMVHTDGRVDEIGWSDSPEGFAEAVAITPKYRADPKWERRAIDRHATTGEPHFGVKSGNVIGGGSWWSTRKP